MLYALNVLLGCLLLLQMTHDRIGSRNSSAHHFRQKCFFTSMSLFTAANALAAFGNSISGDKADSWNCIWGILMIIAACSLLPVIFGKSSQLYRTRTGCLIKVGMFMLMLGGIATVFGFSPLGPVWNLSTLFTLFCSYMKSRGDV